MLVGRQLPGRQILVDVGVERESALRHQREHGRGRDRLADRRGLKAGVAIHAASRLDVRDTSLVPPLDVPVAERREADAGDLQLGHALRDGFRRDRLVLDDDGGDERVLGRRALRFAGRRVLSQEDGRRHDTGRGQARHHGARESGHPAHRFPRDGVRLFTRWFVCCTRGREEGVSCFLTSRDRRGSPRISLTLGERAGSADGERSFAERGGIVHESRINADFRGFSDLRRAQQIGGRERSCPRFARVWTGTQTNHQPAERCKPACD
jgi:hypothetical protein